MSERNSRSRYSGGDESGQVEHKFRSMVNMTAAELRAWLKTPESLEVGFVPPGERESVGHGSGRKIVRMLERGLRTAADVAWAKKVIGYVKRHLAQRPAGDVRYTRWRYSLINWGHDPLGLGHL